MAEVAPARLPGLSGAVGDDVRKSSKHSKKRHRDPNPTEKAERKHKKSKSEAVPVASQAAEVVEDESAPKHKPKGRKSSKSKDSHINGEQSRDELAPLPDADENGEEDGAGRSEKKKHKKGEKSERKSKKKSKESHDQVPADDNEDEDVTAAQIHPDVVVLSSSRSKTQPGATSFKHLYPFYTQTVSQYLPLHPLGINEPIQGYMNQHLEPLLNRYVPSFGGVLLAYRNPRIGEAPGSGSLTQESGMEDMAMFESINEHAVSFGWLTVEIDIFRPSRGVWLEGLVNIQSGGHIGVVCWGKFNASIESGRLPRDWRWVDQHPEKNQDTSPEAAESSPQDNTEAEHTEVHATGYWVDGQGAKVTGDAPICFRIKNYEVGSSGDYGYLSIEGTMLTEEEEEKKVRKEMEALRSKSKHGATLRRERRQLLELGITKFGNDDKQESETQRTEI
ncbi:hypothetical protein F4801DRAFT_436183 [Xylaria longipes]|nr:hypothetical protein F4801DRAFT_436183 [Xylaria longipes]RYC54427.1 hypothetical protein CHU98_g11780 [Xylaria longipes]